METAFDVVQLNVTFTLKAHVQQSRDLNTSVRSVNPLNTMLCKYVLIFKYETYYYIKYNLYSPIITFNEFKESNLLLFIL